MPHARRGIGVLFLLVGLGAIGFSPAGAAPVGQPDRFLPSDHQLPAAANEIRNIP